MAKHKQIKSIKNKIKELEQHTRKENVIISGLATDHKTYARQWGPNDSNTNHNNAPKVELQSLEHKVAGYVKNKLELNIKSSHNSACHTHKNNLRSNPDNIIIKFLSIKKNDVLRKTTD